MNRNGLSFGMIAILLLVALTGGILGGGAVVSLQLQKGAVSQTSDTNKVVEKQVYVEESSIIDTVKQVSPSVVSIVVSKDLPLYRERAFNFDDFFNDPFFGTPFREYDRDESGRVRTQRQKVGGGTGFIVTADGLVLTNRHVVADADADYTVITNDGTEYAAEVVSRDTINDIAVVRMKGDDDQAVSGLPVVTLGDSNKLQIGQKVIAIGNALAEYENSVTTGVISAKGRNIQAGNGNGSSENLINLIQTDAAINPGNSGGPLVNLNGEVVGINTAMASGAQGIGFAIPISDVAPLIASVKEHGKIVRPYLGVRYMMLDPKKAEELEIDVEGGALLTGDEANGEFAVIPGSPADKAGLKIKDVILEIDGVKVSTENTLQSLIAQKSPKDEVTLKVWRSAEILEIKVTLEEAK